MKNLYLQTGIAFLSSLVLSLLAMPGFIRLCLRFQLIDKPNPRKAHNIPIPRLGGFVIFLSALAGASLSTSGLTAVRTWPVFFSALAVLFGTGIWDDLREISARLKLLVQLCCAVAIAATGIRLTGLYGVMGIGQLSPVGQYGLTVVIIVGVTNAFNLIDGVDGLAGGLALIGLAVLGIMALFLQLYTLMVIMIAFAGATLGFLRNNTSPARIFMGDGGSLVLGCLMSVAGIVIIEKAHADPGLIRPSRAATMVTAILIIPVFDALRVFAHRIRKGKSPFKADKTHIHHLFLVAGLDHRRTARFLYVFELLLVGMALVLSGSTQVSVIIGVMVISFHCITEVLRVNHAMEYWMTVIKRMERE